MSVMPEARGSSTEPQAMHAKPQSAFRAAPQPDAGGSDAAGRLLRRLTLLPVLVVMAWLLAGLPLLIAGWFRPVLVLALALPLLAALVAAGLRWIPDTGRSILSAAQPPGTPWWAVIALLAIAIGFGVLQIIYHSEMIIVTRDPASYLQFGYWISAHGSLPIHQNLAAFGGAHRELQFASPAFYQVGRTIVPQFMAGLPMVLSIGFWTGHVGAAVLVAPVLGACAILGFGGLTARLVGARWAPVAAGVLALTLPQMYTSRPSFSEPLTQILLFGGLCLVIDSLSGDPRGARVAAAMAGLAFGLTILVRIDAASDILPVIPYIGLLVVTRRPQAAALAGGLALGVAYGLADGFLLARPYLSYLHQSLVPLSALTVAVIAATAVVVAVLYRRRPSLRGNWLPAAAFALPVLITLGFAIRPYVQTVRDITNVIAQRNIGRFQVLNHLPVDPMRSYAESSLHWVFWYVGVPCVLLGTLGAAFLARRCVAGRVPEWTLPLMIFGWTIVTVLYRPEITPDQPWASRRLVPGVLPGFVLFAVWAVAWLVRWHRKRGFGRVACAAIAFACALVLAVPAPVTSFGLRLGRGGLVADGLALTTTYRGEIAAVNRLCAAIPRNSTVLIITPGPASRLPEVVRGMCGVPTATLANGNIRYVAAIVRDIKGAGRQPVLLSEWPLPLRAYGPTLRQILRMRVNEDTNTLVSPPRVTGIETENLWMAQP